MSSTAAPNRREPPWAELDDGIRETVRALWRAGFQPTDSGDGRRVDRKADMDCALDHPNVFMECDPDLLVAEAERLQALITSWGLPEESEAGAPLVQASYAPADGVGALMLFGVDDGMLPVAARCPETSELPFGDPCPRCGAASTHPDRCDQVCVCVACMVCAAPGLTACGYCGGSLGCSQHRTSIEDHVASACTVGEERRREIDAAIAAGTWQCPPSGTAAARCAS